MRVRPENEREKAGAYNNVINVVDDRMLIFDPKEEQDDFFYQGKKQGRRDLNKRENKDKKFVILLTVFMLNNAIYISSKNKLADLYLHNMI